MTEATGTGAETTPLHDWDISIRELPQAETKFELTASAAQLVAVKQSLDLAVCNDLSLSVTLKSGAHGGVACTGRLTASVDQNCILTLEPVRSAIDEEINALFVQTNPDADAAQPSDEDLNILEDQSLEPFDGKTIEIGRLAFEVLASSLDPYPKAPGAHLGELAAPKSADDDPTASGPFAGLKNLNLPDPSGEPGKG